MHLPFSEKIKFFLQGIPDIFKSLLGISEIGALTRSPGFLEADCIIFRRDARDKELLAFIVNNTEDLFFEMILASAIVVSFFVTFGSRYQARARNSRKVSLLAEWSRNFFLVFVSIFGSPRISAGKVEFLLVCWVVGVWVFQQFFGGDMFSQMTIEMGEVVLDSWADLADRPELQIVAYDDLIMNPKDSKFTYFDRKSPYYADFTARLNLVGSLDALEDYDATLVQVPGLGQVVDLTKFEQDIVVMGMCPMLRFLRDRLRSKMRKSIHVSNTGGDTVPYFMAYSLWTTTRTLAQFNAM